MQLFFSALFRSLLIYFMVPLYEAGEITVAEITALETQLIREQFGLRWDVKSEDI